MTRARERKKGTTFCAQHVNRIASNKFGLFFVVSLFLCVSFNVAALLALSVSITAHGGVAIELRVRKKIQNNNSKKKINRVCYTLLLSLFLSFLFSFFLGTRFV